MIITNPHEKMMCDVASGMFHLPTGFGQSQFGYTHFGDQDVFLKLSEYGSSHFGVEPFGNIFLFTGVWKTYRRNKKTFIVRNRWYCSKNPRTEAQQANRQKYADAVAQWQGLTSDQKKIYNERSKKRNLYGYHFFLKDYLLSH